jgi:hypothetical protein
MSTDVNPPQVKTLTVLYNGRAVELHYRAQESVHELIKHALHHLAIHERHDELALFTTVGVELAEGQTLAEAGVSPGEELVLRQRVVRGGGR